ncbi:60S ribosomal protein L9-RELATED [Anaeramoeba ignava]|uniref:60S ribosomal protein L9-RELATED n=1 Tax=Anaeramoeba ignava TaxID=1746090 RepID=A0A9Q0LW46_ANAIG|nr:60S ribosomal protein L9-RELATED [Anaeramoeba ignava]|eukprot:Anaeramoba_ignava/a620102_213.p1 GENE.a620102_213~~a620102_213.p1  ORF type:complete len:190 (-),score=47.84 a620102_213:260-829(-)
MKILKTTTFVKVPRSVKVKINARKITIQGPKGKLFRDFTHLKLQFDWNESQRKLNVTSWFGRKKDAAAVRTICSHIENMITGVTRGYRFKMRLVYNHFPINIHIPAGHKRLEIRNFLGERFERFVDMLEGVTIKRSSKLKDEVILEGIDLEKVSLSASQIHHATLVKNKDIRMFLDGIYVSEKGNLIQK